MRLWTLVFAALAIGCNKKDTNQETGGDDTSVVEGDDADGDGYTTSSGDCDDTDATVNPGADEIWYDGIDQNCDGADDYDQDGDGVANDTDCDDTDPTVSPALDEVCDGVDNNCDGQIDEGGFAVFLDQDGDGFGAGDPIGTYCELPAGTASVDGDCDDTNGAVNPSAAEVCDGIDDDCDGTIDVDATDASTVYIDADGDGFGDATTAESVCGDVPGTVADGTDCDDTDLLTYPGATELCDLEDNNCDGAIDEGDPESRTYYADTDGDGYGDPAVTQLGCGAPAGYVEASTDCDDTDATRSPGAAEICDGIDNNCNGEIDSDSSDAIAQYQDADGDGYGDDTVSISACAAVDGYVATGGDCNDSDAATSPAAAEVCDTFDNNCDGVVDEATAVDAPSWYLDADADTYGDSTTGTPACEQPLGFVADGSDCDDIDATVNPGAVEVCDGIDNDCSGVIDDGADGGAVTWYADADADGYGDTTSTLESCDMPAGYVADDTDCDDTTAGTYPGASEFCDGVDQDCDGVVDNDALDGSTFYADTDADTYGDAGSSTTACAASAGWVADATDCDDTSAAVNPAATETCNGLDDNCDGTVDGSGATGTGTWYTDADGDGYGDAASSSVACSAPAGSVANASDCNDASAAVNPGATETCNGTDDNCDGQVDESGATGASTWYLDADADGYGVSTTTVTACDAPAGYTDLIEDCDDAEPAANPGATEVADGIDNNCDGTIDEGTTVSPGVGDVIISEVDRQPWVDGRAVNTNAQWFELYNTTSADIDLSNWYLTRTSTALGRDGFYVDPSENVVIGANSYAVFCKTDNFTAASSAYSTLVCDYFWGDETKASSYSGTYRDNTFNLQASTDTLQVYYGGDATSGTLIDQVAWTYDATSGYWPRDATHSMSLDPAALDSVSNDDLNNWCSTPNTAAYRWYQHTGYSEWGTPGTANYDCP